MYFNQCFYFLPAVVASVDDDGESFLVAKTVGTVMAVTKQPNAIRPSATNIGVRNRVMKLFRKKLSDQNSFLKDKFKPCWFNGIYCWRLI